MHTNTYIPLYKYIYIYKYEDIYIYFIKFFIEFGLPDTTLIIFNYKQGWSGNQIYYWVGQTMPSVFKEK